MSNLPEDEDERLDRLLAVAADESQPPAIRLKAASEILPYCYDPVPPKHVEITGEPMNQVEWLRKAQAEAGVTQWQEKKRAADPAIPLNPAPPTVKLTEI